MTSTTETDGMTEGRNTESYTKRRPRVSLDQWIDLDDFKSVEDLTNLNKKYTDREQVNKLLNTTYVAMEKAEEINGWSGRKKRAIIEWKNIIEYQFIVNWFFVYELKKKESWWSWLVIVISTFTSTLSLVRPTDTYAKIFTESFLSFFSVVTTLIAAWIKKQNYIDRIKNMDRYIQKLSKLNVELEYIVSKSPWDRVDYTKFMDTYESQIVQLLSSSPPMAPEEFKETIWRLTRFYPELVKNIYPWYERNDEGESVRTEYGKHILLTYDAVYYESCLTKICSCYYCKCKCCRVNDNYIDKLYKSQPPQPWLPNNESLNKLISQQNINKVLAQKLNEVASKEFDNSASDSIIEIDGKNVSL